MKERAKILVFDDDPDSLESICRVLRRDGFEVVPFADPKEGMAHLRSDGADVVVTDLKMPGLSGMEVIRRIAKEVEGVPVVVVTAFGTVEGAVEAMREGAADFLPKPVEVPRLRAAVFKAAREREKNREIERKDREIERLRDAVGRAEGFAGIIGASRGMEEVLRKVRLVAPMRINVLIQGESGTGKELVARAIHELSPRREHPFLPLNCAAIPETLLESELFGYEKGAFTGAVAARPGKIELAQKGTLFLDEIGEISPAIQAKLLRVLEGKEVLRVGGARVVTVDVRILAATNRDLAARVEEKAFREDLFYRINAFAITVPPLRERREDIPKLADHFLGEAARENGVPPKRIAPEALKALMAYRWPGNVRELRNAMEAAAIVARGEAVAPGDLPPGILREELPPSAAAPIPLPPARTLDEIEREAIRAALSAAGGNKTQAARALGIGLRTLHRKVKEYGIA